MKITFPYESKPSSIFREVKRPIAKVNFWSKKFNRYLEYLMIVDTGADYTLFPLSTAYELGIDLKKECKTFKTAGIGGEEKTRKPLPADPLRQSFSEASQSWHESRLTGSSAKIRRDQNPRQQLRSFGRGQALLKRLSFDFNL